MLYLIAATLGVFIGIGIAWPLARSSGYDDGQREGAAQVAKYYNRDRTTEIN